MDDPVFDFYKKFYKKASSWFLGTIIVLVVVIVIGVAYVAIAKLKANDTNKNTNTQTTTEQEQVPIDNTNGKTDTQMNEQDLFNEPEINNLNSNLNALNQNSLNNGTQTNPYGSGATSLDGLGL